MSYVIAGYLVVFATLTFYAVLLVRRARRVASQVLRIEDLYELPRAQGRSQQGEP